MKSLADAVLNQAHHRGVSYCDMRFIDDRHRALAVRNGKLAQADDSDSIGIGIRVLADGAWGFAATEHLTREGVEAAAEQAVRIARASATVKDTGVQLAPEGAH